MTDPDNRDPPDQAQAERLLLLARHAGSLVFWATKTAAEGCEFVNQDDRGDTTNRDELTYTVGELNAVLTLMAGCRDLDTVAVSGDCVVSAQLTMSAVADGRPGALRHQDVSKLAANMLALTLNHEQLLRSVETGEPS